MAASDRARERLRKVGVAARANRYRRELKRERPLRAIHLVGVFGTAGFAFVGAILRGISCGSVDPLYSSMSTVCLFGMIACVTLAMLPMAFRIGRGIAARRRRLRARYGSRYMHIPDMPQKAPSEAPHPPREAVPAEETFLTGHCTRKLEQDPWSRPRPSDKGSPHAVRLVGILGAFGSVLVGSLLRGIPDASTYVLYPVLSYACFIGLPVSVLLVAFPNALRVVRRHR